MNSIIYTLEQGIKKSDCFMCKYFSQTTIKEHGYCTKFALFDPYLYGKPYCKGYSFVAGGKNYDFFRRLKFKENSL